jgi:hypothetical protein
MSGVYQETAFHTALFREHIASANADAIAATIRLTFRFASTLIKAI